MEMKEVLHILLNFRTGALPSDCLVSYPEHMFGVELTFRNIDLGWGWGRELIPPIMIWMADVDLMIFFSYPIKWPASYPVINILLLTSGAERGSLWCCPAAPLLLSWAATHLSSVFYQRRRRAGEGPDPAVKATVTGRGVTHLSNCWSLPWIYGPLTSGNENRFSRMDILPLPKIEYLKNYTLYRLNSGRTSVEDLSLPRTLKKLTLSSPTKNTSLFLISVIKICRLP